MLVPGVTINSDRVVVNAAANPTVSFINEGFGFSTITTATNTYNSGAAQTETVPALSTRVVIELVGPGGNGGAGNTASPGGGGGGGGAYVKYYMPVTPGQTFTYTVGTASGTASTVISGTATVPSLRAGSGTNGATSAAGGAAGTGGVASGGITNTDGTAGTAGVAGAGGAGGAGGAPLGGAGAASPGTGAGTNGTAPGGAGSGTGSASAAAGGTGAAGRIIFTYAVDKLAVDTNAVSGTNSCKGIAMNASGAVYGTTTDSGTNICAGLKISATGQVVYESAASTGATNGNPLTANGRLAVI